MVAAEAGVGAATAYTYFSSKEHLVAEVFWRRLASSPVPPTDSPDLTVRVIAVLRQIALLVADEPELAGAVTNALLGKDPEVEHLRLRIGREIHQRLAAALGPDNAPDLVESLELLYAGALVRAGMGYASNTQIAERLETSARLLLARTMQLSVARTGSHNAYGVAGWHDQRSWTSSITLNATRPGTPRRALRPKPNA